MPLRPSGKRVLVARIGAAHGVRGDVKLWSFTVDPAAIAAYRPLTDASGTRSFEIETMRAAKDCFVARLKGVNDRNAAEALRNVDLYVERELLPTPDEDDEFYHADLIGLAAVHVDGTPLGTVMAVQNFGAGDLLEIQPSMGDSLYVPFTMAVVPTVDLAGGRVVIDPPPGLLDDDDDGEPAEANA